MSRHVSFHTQALVAIQGAGNTQGSHRCWFHGRLAGQELLWHVPNSTCGHPTASFPWKSKTVHVQHFLLSDSPLRLKCTLRSQLHLPGGGGHLQWALVLQTARPQQRVPQATSGQFQPCRMHGERPPRASASACLWGACRCLGASKGASRTETRWPTGASPPCAPQPAPGLQAHTPRFHTRTPSGPFHATFHEESMSARPPSAHAAVTAPSSGLPQQPSSK